MSESQVHLDRRTVKFSFIWTAIETYAGQGIQFIIGIILARLLMPTDYGAVGVITVFLSLSTAIISAGFPTALLKKQDCQHIDYCTVFYFNLGIGLFLSIILYVCAPYIARFFNMPILDHVTKAMTLTIFFPAISGVSHVILRKNLKFKLIASITILISILSGIIGIILAFCGYGVWALVVQSVASSFLRMIVTIYIAKWKPSFAFSMKSFKQMFSFGSKVFSANILNQLYFNLYNVLIGKLYSATDLSYFTRASSYSTLIPTNISGVIQGALFPLLTKVQENPTELQKFHTKMVLMTSFIIFPASFILGGLSYPLIDILLTSRWLPCAPLLTILCIGILPEHIYYINNDFLILHGKSNLLMKEQTYSKIISTLLVLISIPYGLIVAAIVKGICTFITWGFSFYYLKKVMDIRIKGQLNKLIGIFVMSFFIGSANFICFTIIHYSVINLVMAIGLSLIAYYIFSKLYCPEIIDDIKSVKK